MRGAGAYGEPYPSASKLNRMLDLYFQICSIEISSEQGAIMAAMLANGGICPKSGEQYFDTETIRDCVSLMFSCGMYDFSGEFAFDVGLPAKSGVSGSIMLVVPGKFGLCIWSPPLDDIGNSVRGVEICRRLSNTCSGNYHIFRHIGKIEQEHTNIDVAFYSCMDAIVRDDIEKLRAYLNNVNIGRTDYDNRSLLHIACSEGKIDMIKMLIDKGATQCHDRWGNTPKDDLNRFISENKESLTDKQINDFELLI
jgi:glutaminase